MYYLYQNKQWQSIHTVVIGSGPTGLAASFLLKQQGVPHVLLEKTEHVASSWYALWDNYRLAMSLDEIDMPGADFYQDSDKNIHPTRYQMISFFKEYARSNKLPIQYLSPVIRVQKNGLDKFEVETLTSVYVCENVICCIGPRHERKLPLDAALLQQREDIQVMHSQDYRSTAQFRPTDKILVVGSGVTALSITQDIMSNGFKVELACGYTSEEIVLRNQHLYAKRKQSKIVPTLADLEQQGLKNHGRFLSCDNQTLKFIQHKQEHSLSIKQYNVFIFATGYTRSFEILGDVLKLNKETKAPLLKNGLSEIPGLYIGGIPPEDQPTVVISDGTENAKKIVADICKVKLVPKIPAKL